MKRAHNFLPHVDPDSTCSRCYVTIAPRVHNTFALPCPAGDCLSIHNPDRGCVFVWNNTHGSRCLYCGRSGGDRPEPEDIPDEWDLESDLG